MNKLILFAVLVLFSFKKNCEGVEFVNQCNSVDCVKIVDEVVSEIEGKLSNKYRVKPLGGNDKIVDCVSKPIIEFQIVGPLKKDELRMILIDVAEEFINIINSNKKLRPFLKKYPFTANEVDVGIAVFNNKDKFVFYPNIFLASSRSGKLYFHTLDKNNEYEYKTTEVEDYEEALKIVRSKK